MGDENRSRSSSAGMTGLDAAGSGLAGVGGRQAQGRTAAGGGGSPDNCSDFEIHGRGQKNRGATDPRLDELREMGMRPRWIHIAEQIGVDAFLVLWRLLDENPPNMPGTTVYVSMPRFTRYLRYQRNRFVEVLVQEGLSARDIQRQVRRELCEDISIRHIDRISEKLRKR
ncbi:MAG: hypothetical protein ACOY5W_08955 [Pseudomonadota bacterium]